MIARWVLGTAHSNAMKRTKFRDLIVSVIYATFNLSVSEILCYVTDLHGVHI